MTRRNFITASVTGALALAGPAAADQHSGSGGAPHTEKSSRLEEAWNTLDTLAASSNPVHRQYASAAYALLAQTKTRAFTGARKLLADDKDFGVRAFTAAALGQERCRVALAALREALDDPAGTVAFAAAKALWDMGDRSGGFIFEEVLTGERKDSAGMIDGYLSDARRKMHDPKSLALMGVKEATGAFLGPAAMAISFAQESLKDKGAAGRAFAAGALATDHRAQSLQVLESALQDSNGIVRAAACRSLLIRGDRTALPFIAPLLTDKSETAQAIAAAAYIRLSASARSKPPGKKGA